MSSSGKSPSKDLKVQEIASYLINLSNLYNRPSTGNPEMYDALRELANALNFHSRKPFQKLIIDIQSLATNKVRDARTGKKIEKLPENIESMSLQDVELVLVNPAFKRDQLAEVAERRFGISHSRFSSCTKREIIDTTLAAASREKSKDIISKEAIRSGGRRST